MIKNDLIAKIAGFGIFYRWHPAIALRYLPFVDEIKKIKDVRNILEVGSAGLGITPYLRREVTGVDIEFSPPFHPLLKRIKGNALKLPFLTSSFDVALSVDMLEHLRGKDREAAIAEMLRVAKRRVFIGVPSGRTAQREDKVLHKLYNHRFGRKYKFFEEQIQENLPEKDTLLTMIKNAALVNKKAITVKIVGNENIAMHRFLMKGWMTRNILGEFFFRKILLFAIPLLRTLDKSPYYRLLFFVTINHESRN